MKDVHGAGSEPPRPRNPLFALLLGNLIGGAALGLMFVVGALALDLGHLRKLILSSEDGAIALFLFSIGSVVTFASAAMGSAIMMIGPRRDSGKPGTGLKDGGHPLLLVPLHARVGARGGASHKKRAESRD